MQQNVNKNLICAVREGKLETARELINSFGLSHSPAWSEGYNLLRDAVKNKHAAVAELLLTSGSKVNSKNRKPSNTPLHFAAINGDIEIVEMIVNKGAKIDARNQSGRTPLYNAIENEKIEVTELLLKHRADVNARDKDGISLLHIAAEIGCLQIVKHLLEYGADVNCVCTSKCKNGYVPLHFAVEKGSTEVVTLLLSRGANVDVKGEDGVTSLHIAAKNGYIRIAEDLLNHGACIHSLTLKEAYTPLHFATKAGHETVVKLLLQHGAKVDNPDNYGKTILHLAVENGYLSIVKDVLKYCPDINNESSRSCFKIAVQGYTKKDKKIVEALLEYGLIANPEDANDRSLLHAAVENGYLKIVGDLLKYGANVNAYALCESESKWHEGFTPLHSAANYKQEEIAKLLISYEADINAQDKKGKTPIFYAIKNADFKMTKLLLTSGANVKDSPMLLNIAVRKECIEIVVALLQHDVDINASDKHGRTALHFTALSESEFLTKKYHKIPIKGEIAKLLLSKGANVDAQTLNGETTLQLAIQEGHEKVIEALLEYNANVNFRARNDFTPLHLSSKIGNENISTMLLNKGAKVDSKIKNGITPLHVAAVKGDEEIIQTLLKFGADINSRDEYGRTALHIASQEGHNEVVATLLEYGSDINITSRSDNTPLDHAVAGMRFSTQYDDCYFDPEDYYDSDWSCEDTILTLQSHIVKMETANLYVSEKNLLSMYKLLCSADDISINRSHFQDECEEEIARMKSEKINDSNISFYDILAKDTCSLAIYMRNENIVLVLKSEDYKTKFPIYASMIKSHFKKCMERKELLEQGNKVFHLLFPELPVPHDCTDKIFSYLNNEDLRIFMDACKPLSISNPNTY